MLPPQWGETRDGDGRRRRRTTRRSRGGPGRAAPRGTRRRWATGGVGMGRGGPRRACVLTTQSGVGGVVLGSGVVGSMETSPRGTVLRRAESGWIVACHDAPRHASEPRLAASRCREKRLRRFMGQARAYVGVRAAGDATATCGVGMGVVGHAARALWRWRAERAAWCSAAGLRARWRRRRGGMRRLRAAVPCCGGSDGDGRRWEGSWRATPRERCGDGERSGRRGMGLGEPRRATGTRRRRASGGSWRATPRVRCVDGERSGRRGARQRG